MRTINPEFIVSAEQRDKGGLLHGGLRIEAITGTRIKRVIIIHPSRAAAVPPLPPPRSSNGSTPKTAGGEIDSREPGVRRYQIRIKTELYIRPKSNYGCGKKKGKRIK